MKGSSRGSAGVLGIGRLRNRCYAFESLSQRCASEAPRTSIVRVVQRFGKAGSRWSSRQGSVRFVIGIRVSCMLRSQHARSTFLKLSVCVCFSTAQPVSVVVMFAVQGINDGKAYGTHPECITFVERFC